MKQRLLALSATLFCGALLFVPGITSCKATADADPDRLGPPAPRDPDGSPFTGTDGQGGTGRDGEGGAGSHGQGIVVEGDFSFTIVPVRVDVPYDDLGDVEVTIERLDGFDAPVEVDVLDAPTGLVVTRATLEPDDTTGKLSLGASGTLSIGTTFTLTLTAKAGDLTHTGSVPAVVTSKAGSLDPSFHGGIFSWTLGTDAAALYDLREARQGKILTAGFSADGLGGTRFEGARLLPDGGLDTTFATTGRVGGRFCSCTRPHEARSMIQLFDGTLVLTGSGSAGPGTTSDVGLMAFKNDGTPHTVGNDEGKALFDLGGDETVRAVALSADEHLLVTGASNERLFVTAIRPMAHKLDNAFGTNGRTFVDHTGGTAGGEALVIDGSSRVIVAGWTEANGDRDILLVRLLPSGQIDPFFGNAGRVTIARTGQQQPVGVLLQPSGHIVLLARTDEAGSADFLVLRRNANGTPDPTFGDGSAGDDGGLLLDLTGGDDDPVALVRLSDGRFVLAGNATDPLLVRLQPNGLLDPTFGTNAVQHLDLGVDDVLQSMAVTTDGKLLVAGRSEGYPFKGVIARVFN
ncbi:hypothetical protein [Chondromyces crocatus]|uniref:Uncharacterized protein n=1 Tax=Chondromyces crocatus TaxID=52 RepID=A0A0K1EEE6_CHOCO|nr:hypothetical protein [Chondromyces crocatus]AKT39224.1 uncharacterized protein CMC5_033730 [Chondromyces crocatus]